MVILRPNDGIGYGSGTLYSAPIVAGVAGLIKAQNPSFTPTQIRERLIAGATNIQNDNDFWFNSGMGAGVLNAGRSLSYNEVELDRDNYNLIVNDTAGNNNGFLEPSENGTLEISLKNNGAITATNTPILKLLLVQVYQT